MTVRRPRGVGGLADYGHALRRHAAVSAAARAFGDAAQEAEGPTAEGETDWTTQAQDVASRVAPIVKAFLDRTSTENVEVLRARIASHKRIRDSLPEGGALWTLYDNKLRVLQARLRGQLQSRKHEREDRVSRRQWAGLGKGAVVVGIGVGLALIYAILRRSRGPVVRGGSA